MKKIFLVAVAVCLLAGVRTFAQNEPYTPPTAETETIAGVVKHTNLRYGPIPDTIPDSRSDRIFDLYLPAGAAAGKPVPVYLFVHGGGFSGGDKSLHPDMHRLIAGAGFAVMSINYRLRFSYHPKPGGGLSKEAGGASEFPSWYRRAVHDAAEDADMALAWIRDHGAEYNLDPKTVFAGGGSAGAITVLYLVYGAGRQALPVRGVVDFWGGLENTAVIRHGAPPALIYHGDRDATIHFDYSVAIKHRMDEIGEKRTILHILGGRGHAQYKYITANRTDEIIAFFRSLMR